MECDVVFFKLPREDVHPSHGLGIYLSTLSISGSVVLVVKWGSSRGHTGVVSLSVFSYLPLSDTWLI